MTETRLADLLDGWIAPQWSVPAGIRAVMTTRDAGMGSPPYRGFNLASHVGDEPQTVARHRKLLHQATGAVPVFLDQVHGCGVVRLPIEPVPAQPARADAAWTSEPGWACTVMVADCLPVLFAARDGSAVAAAHAGWRGLAGGVLEATLQALRQGAGCAPDEVVAWLGPCIGPRHFEVGEEVLLAFEQAMGARARAHFRPAAPGKWWADLPSLARSRLAAAGVREVTGGRWCTVEDASRFYSFRRDRVTGRMAALVWIERD